MDYSPNYFYDLWQNRIAIATYKKNVIDKWDDAEFSKHTGTLPLQSHRKPQKKSDIKTQHSKNKICYTYPKQTPIEEKKIRNKRGNRGERNGDRIYRATKKSYLKEYNIRRTT